MKLSAVPKELLNAAFCLLRDSGQEIVDDFDSHLEYFLLRTDLGSFCHAYAMVLEKRMGQTRTLEETKALLCERAAKLVVFGIYVGYEIARLEETP